MSLLLIVYFALFIFLCIKNLKLGILLTIFLLPGYLIRFSVLQVPTTLLEISILSCFLVWFVKNHRTILKTKIENGKTFYPFGLEIILILALSFIAVFVGGLNNSALGIFKAYFLEPIMFFVVILNTFKGGKGLKQIIMTLAYSTLIVSAFAVYQKITGQFIFNEFWANPENRRIVSFFGYPNAVALYLGPIIPLLAGLFFWQLRGRGGLKTFWEQIILLFSIILNILAIYFAQSKGAILALIISLFLVAFLLLKKKLKIIILIIIILGSSSFYYFQKDWINLKLSSSLSYQIRSIQWDETMKMLQNGNLLWGSGLAKYKEAIEPYHQEGFFFNKDADPDFRRKVVFGSDQNYRTERWQPLEIYLYPHNIFLNFWVELGFIGMLVFTFLILRFIFLSLKYYFKNKGNRNGDMALGLFASMSIILIHGLFDVPYFKNDLAVLFWIIIALLAMFKLQKGNLTNYGKNKFD